MGFVLVLMGFGFLVGEVLMLVVMIFVESFYVVVLVNVGFFFIGVICLRVGLIMIWRDKKVVIFMFKVWRILVK